MKAPLNALLIRHGNDHRPLTRRFETTTGHRWHEAGAAAGQVSVSVVLPARNVAYCLPAVLDALAAQSHRAEVIVVDDASTDATAAVARAHPVVDRLIVLPERLGAAAARNVGIAAARGQVLVFVDADMLLPAHVIADLAARACDEAVLIGFRHNVAHGAALPPAPDLAADHRVCWRPPAHTPLMYSGLVLDEPLDGRPLDATRDLLDLGNGRTYYDWDLPRMVVTALLAVPRSAVVDVGGFDAVFGRLGWGMEDTHLGAKLIAAGLRVVPVRPAVGFHLDAPEAAALWQAKLASWPATLAYYRSLLPQPAPMGCTSRFTQETHALLSRCEVLR